MNPYSRPGTEHNIELIISDVLNRFDVTIDELKSKSRNHKCVIPRQLLMAIEVAINVKQGKGFLYHHVGKRWNRGHATVIHAVKVVHNDYHTNRMYRYRIGPILACHEVELVG